MTARGSSVWSWSSLLRGCSCRRDDDNGRLPARNPAETGYVQPGLVEIQHAEALGSLGDLTGARTYAQRAVAVAAESHKRGTVHRLATIATILANQGDAEAAAGVMVDKALGMESCRVERPDGSGLSFCQDLRIKIPPGARARLARLIGG